MNKILLDNRPEGMSKEDFIQAWESNITILEPLYKTLIKFAEGLNPPVKDEDFNNSNHYGLMVSKASKLQAIQQVMELFPNRVKVR